MSHLDLDELVLQARRERATPGALAAVARGLRVPFATAPIAALVVPSTATAGVLAKAGLARVLRFSWGVGSAVVASGLVASVALRQPPTPALVLSPAPVAFAVNRQDETQVAVAEPAPGPSDAAASTAPRVVKEASVSWEEPQLIERARKALGSDPRRALTLAQEHRRRFPAGALGVERDVIVVEALARSGQQTEARRRALAFEAQYPNSIHLSRVRGVLTRLGGP